MGTTNDLPLCVGVGVCGGTTNDLPLCVGGVRVWVLLTICPCGVWGSRGSGSRRGNLSTTWGGTRSNSKWSADEDPRARVADASPVPCRVVLDHSKPSLHLGTSAWSPSGGGGTV